MAPQSAVQESKKREAGDKPAIVVKNLTKEFVIPHERRTTLFENIRGILSPNTYEKFTALKDVSFTVNKGDSLGIIGENGSGKSTLLKIIAHILKPTSGKVEVYGTITPFLELGVGFQNDLTAAENIEVYSTIMGLSSRKIARNMDSVLEFAGLTRFRDTKLKNFSSGMQVRLAFSTAIQTRPDILLIDEVLAVGDMDFQEKCFDVFRKYKGEGVTMIFVSHDLGAVRRFCDKALLLKEGGVVACGEVNHVIDSYVYGAGPAEAPAAVPPAPVVVESAAATPPRDGQDADRWGNKKIEISEIQLVDKHGSDSGRFSSGDDLTIVVHYKINEPVDDPVFGLQIVDEHGNLCFGTNTKLRDMYLRDLGQEGRVNLHITSLPVLSGKYFVTVAISSRDMGTIYDWHDRRHSFNVSNNNTDVGYIRFLCDFSVARDR